MTGVQRDGRLSHGYTMVFLLPPIAKTCSLLQRNKVFPMYLLTYLLTYLQRIIEDMQLRPHMYADDTQIYVFFCLG